MRLIVRISCASCGSGRALLRPGAPGRGAMRNAAGSSKAVMISISKDELIWVAPVIMTRVWVEGDSVTHAHLCRGPVPRNECPLRRSTFPVSRLRVMSKKRYVRNVNAKTYAAYIGWSRALSRKRREWYRNQYGRRERKSWDTVTRKG